MAFSSEVIAASHEKSVSNEQFRASPDPAVPSFTLYAFNWIVYFSGQVLVGCFPALAIESQQPAEG